MDIGNTGAAPAWAGTTLNLPMVSAAGATAGLLARSEYDALQSKIGPARQVQTAAPLTGGGTLAADLTIQCPSCETTGNKNSPNGYAGLTGNGLLSAAQVPALGGDVSSSGGAATLTVTGLQGRMVAPAAPAGGQVLGWNASQNHWEPQSVSSVASVNGSSGAVNLGVGTTGTSPAWAGTTLNLPMVSAAGATSGLLARSEYDMLQSKIGPARQVQTAAPLTGGGTLAADLTIQCPSCETTGNKNAPNGYAGLTGNGWLSAAQVPALGGDVSSSGGAATLTVTGLQGRTVAPAAPAGGQVLGWNASQNHWEPQSVSSGGSGVSSVNGDTGSVTLALGSAGTAPAWAGTTLNLPMVSASGATSGLLARSEYDTLQSKVGPARQVQTAAPLAGGGTLAGDLTIQCPSCETTGNKDTPNGYAGLSGSGWLAAAQLPALGGDVTSSGGSSAITVTGLQGRPIAGGAPEGGQVLGWNAALSQWEAQTPSSSGGTATSPKMQRWAYIVYPGAGTTMNALGDSAAMTGTASGQAATDNEPATLNIATSATTDTRAEIVGYTVWRSQRNPRLQAYVQLPSAGDYSNVRSFIGVLDGNGVNATAEPWGTGMHGFGFRARSGVDTNWQCAQVNGSSPDTADSGVVIDNTGRKFEVYYDYSGAKVHYYIDGNEVCTGMSQANRPASGYNLRYLVSLRTLDSVAKNIRIGWVYLQADK